MTQHYSHVTITTKKICPYAERNRQHVPVDLLHLDEGRSRARWSCAIFLLAPQPDRARVTMMCAHAGKLTKTPFCLFLRSLRHPPSLHIHLKRTSMCGFSLNPPPPPPPPFQFALISWMKRPVFDVFDCSFVPDCFLLQFSLFLCCSIRRLPADFSERPAKRSGCTVTNSRATSSRAGCPRRKTPTPFALACR